MKYKTRGPDGRFIARPFNRYLAPCIICNRMSMFPRWVKLNMRLKINDGKANLKGAWCSTCQRDWASNLEIHWVDDNDPRGDE